MICTTSLVWITQQSVELFLLWFQSQTTKCPRAIASQVSMGLDEYTFIFCSTSPPCTYSALFFFKTVRRWINFNTYSTLFVSIMRQLGVPNSPPCFMRWPVINIDYWYALANLYGLSIIFCHSRILPETQERLSAWLVQSCSLLSHLKTLILVWTGCPSAFDFAHRSQNFSFKHQRV